MIATLSPEQQFLVACARQTLSREPAGGEKLPEATSLDWDAAVDLAFREGLAPIVYTGLQLSDLDVPVEAMDKLRIGYLGAVTRTEACLTPALRCVLERLTSLGIKPIVLKGAALAYTVYPDTAHRTMADIDLLVDRDVVEAARSALQGMGFLSDGRTVEQEHHIRPHYLPDWRLGVEIHRMLLPQPNPYAVDLEDCRSRCRVAEIAGVEAAILAPLDTLHFTCLHLAFVHRYRWYTLRSLVDLLAITTAWARDLDWDLFLEVIDRSRTAGAVYWPLLLARRWLEAPVPENVLSSLAPSKAMGRLMADIATPEYLLGDRVPEGRGSDVLYNLLLNLSLYQGCSPFRQAHAMLLGIFPTPDAVGHLPEEVASSRLRYTTYIGNPARMARGLVAFGRMLCRHSNAQQ
ncbi:MAG: nucleotidyltransferase family protein [Chloroflexota bacterium]